MDIDQSEAGSGSGLAVEGAEATVLFATEMKLPRLQAFGLRQMYAAMGAYHHLLNRPGLWWRRALRMAFAAHDQVHYKNQQAEQQ